MLGRVAELLGLRAGAVASHEDAARLAAAALLMEATIADGTERPAEIAMVERLVAERFGLGQAAARDLIDQGRAAAHGSTDLVRHTRALKQALDADQRIAIVIALWQVVLADGELDGYEEALVRQVAGLLHVTDGDRARARRRALETQSRGRV
jgi:uncharacterized tellurite resistance protein B-like protein